MNMDFKEFQKIIDAGMLPRDGIKCECGHDCPKEKTEQVEDLQKLIDDLMAELGFNKVDEKPRPQKSNATPKVKTIKCCPVCYGGNLVRGMKLYKKVADEPAIKFYEVPVVYCPNCGRKLGEDK